MKMKALFTAAIAVSMGGLASIVSAQDTAPQQPAAAAPEPAVSTLDQLLNQVRQGKVSETNQHRAREQEFVSQQNRQNELLQQARRDRDAEERRSEQLEATITENERRIAQREQQLQEKLGVLRELFGVLQQVAGDMRGIITGSLISVQYENRGDGIDTLIAKASQSSTLPTIDEIEELWEQMLLEMGESSKVVAFPHEVVTSSGEPLDVQLVRIGDFNLIANGKYYNFLAETGKVVELSRQPAARFTSAARDLEQAAAGEVVSFGVDPTRGQLLSLLVQAPSLRERIDQGREVGYLIIVLGAFGIAIVIYKMITLSMTSSKVRAQIRSGTPSPDNPLGRVLMAYEENKTVDVETLELKLDEAILKETPALERGLTIIKIISAVAPLFGLLGTVTGMIATFQAITLFGTGDPKLMANGISQALVTTVLGLVVAIPTLLLHSFVAGMSKRVIHVLEEQSAGIIAVHAEKENAGARAQ